MSEPSSSRTPPDPDAPGEAETIPEPDPFPEPMEAQLRAVERAFDVAVANLPRLEEALGSLRVQLGGHTDPTLAARCRLRLAPLLRQRPGPLARALFSFLTDGAGDDEGAALPDQAFPPALVSALLEARDPSLRRQGVSLILDRVARGALDADVDLALSLARRIEADPELDTPAVLERVGDMLHRMPGLTGPGADRDPVEALFLRGAPPALRELAARVLDRSGEPAPPDRIERLLGPDASRFLAPYLAFTRATHRDLTALTPTPGAPPPALDSLRHAAAVLGEKLLGTVIARLGWARLTWGLHAERRVALSVADGFPLMVSPAEAELLAACSRPVRQVAERFLITAHGGVSLEGETDPGSDAVIQRFRRYNLAHAATLEEILEIAPLTPRKVARILELMDRIVADYAALFADHTDEALRLPARYQELKRAAEADLERLDPEEPLPPDVTRSVQMFEDPRSLAEVRTLHGLKRYLHQSGLRLAFRLFQSSRTTNRTVDLVLADARRVLHVVQSIRYLDFEPETGAGPLGLPYPVRLAAEAFGRHLFHELGTLPSLEILRYGNEVQVYVQFRNHPAFLRLDLSPPLRGGMIDLEYYGVSQYEVEHHPDLSLPAIQHTLRQMEFDVAQSGPRLNVRYDKERAFDLADLGDKTAAMFRLVPYLMDLDWTIGGLDYPEPARQRVAEAWAGFFLRWGVLPMERFLTADRRRVLRAVVSTAAGEEEVAWDGRGDYRDRFSTGAGDAVLDRLREVMEARGLDRLARWAEEAGQGPAQLPLERAVLAPLREAVARGEVVETDPGLRPAPAERFVREHEAERLARILHEGGARLTAAIRLAGLVNAIERQFRFRTTGTIQDHAVERAVFPLRGEVVGLFTLRDEQGLAGLAVAAPEAVLYRHRLKADHPWSPSVELDVEELTRRLRGDKYLTAGDEAPPPLSDDAARARAAHLARPDPRARPALQPGDRVLTGTTAAPGRATGFARFGPTGATADELEGAVLLAPVIRPEDAPLLRRAEAIVSTGGGILSHIGLIALELQKPALIIQGRWSQDDHGTPQLTYRRLEYREEEFLIGPFQVMRRRSLREREEAVKEDDLVVVDADASRLVVLGQDRDALALHQELRSLEDAAARLDHVQGQREVLVVRGRLIRAVHQLERLAARIDRPALARHAVRELFRVGPTASDLDHRACLLRPLFDNPHVGQAAEVAALGRLDELARKRRALVDEALETIPCLGNLYEVLFLRLAVRRVDSLYRQVAELVTRCGLEARPVAEERSVDDAARSRLEALAQSLDRSIREAAGPDGDPPRPETRHLLQQRERLDAVLPDAASDAATSLRAGAQARLTREDEARVAALRERNVLGPADGGAELGTLIGMKAANLGEIAGLIGAPHVPDWFAVTDRVFRAMLACPAPVRPAETAGLGLPADATLGRAVAAVLVQPDWDTGRQTETIRALWQAVALPAPLEAEIVRAYRRLDADPAAHPEGPFVAIRSSAFEEDSESSAWAGQFDTFLFVRGERAVLDHLKRAWAGLWSERVLDRRRTLGAGDGRAGGGVIVQRMVNARVSGVLHTVWAATGQLLEMAVNVGLGLGEGVVSGTVDVDQVFVVKDEGLERDPLHFRYRVGDKRTQVVLDDRAGLGTRTADTLYHQRLRPALEYVELAELARLAARLEKLHGQPLDLEFAIEESSLYVLQARPVALFHAAWRETRERYPLAANQEDRP